MSRLRATRIVATVGPATDRETDLYRLIRAGVDVFRFNMSHGERSEHAGRMERLRAAARRAGRPVGILVDLSGPKLRTGWNEEGKPVVLRRGSEVQLVFTDVRTGSGRSAAGRLVILGRELASTLRPGDTLLLDDGRLAIEATGRRGGWSFGRVLRGGLLKEHAGVNLPGRSSGLRAPTAKDRRDARFARRQKVDFVALSFVQQAEDLVRLRRLLGPRPPLVIAKLEKPAALEDLERILQVADGVMVARGDLGVELSLEEVPLWQKEILRRARAHGVFTITATEMLQSMVNAVTPTRAEVSDVANAILDGTDALMLSAETATGKFPVEAVRVLDRVARRTDPAWLERTVEAISGEHFEPPGRVDPGLSAIARAAVELAAGIRARWIVVFTLTGRTVRLLSRYRSPVPILALTPHEETRRRLNLEWNVQSLLSPPAASVEEMMRRGMRLLRQERMVRKGDRLVLAAGAAGVPEATNLLRIITIDR